MEARLACRSFDAERLIRQCQSLITEEENIDNFFNIYSNYITKTIYHGAENLESQCFIFLSLLETYQ